MTATGFKFYCTIRANHSVSRGTWYFEVKITDMKEGAATRIGWAQRYANLQVSSDFISSLEIISVVNLLPSEIFALPALSFMCNPLIDFIEFYGYLFHVHNV